MHRTTNVRYHLEQDVALLGRHNKRGQQVNLPQSTRNTKITNQKYFNRQTKTLPKFYENTLSPDWKRHGNVVTTTRDRMHVLRRAGVKAGFGVVVPVRAKDTKTAYFSTRQV